MTRLYLKPLQPPGCTLTRRTPCSTVTPSASMNFLTSTPAFGVTVKSISGCDETDIYPPVLHEFMLLLQQLVVRSRALLGTTWLSTRRRRQRRPALPVQHQYFSESACRFRTARNTPRQFRRSNSSRRALRPEWLRDRNQHVRKP